MVHGIPHQPCAHRICEHVLDLVSQLFFAAESTIESFLLPDRTSMSEFPVNSMR